MSRVGEDDGAAEGGAGGAARDGRGGRARATARSRASGCGGCSRTRRGARRRRPRRRRRRPRPRRRRARSRSLRAPTSSGMIRPSKVGARWVGAAVAALVTSPATRARRRRSIAGCAIRIRSRTASRFPSATARAAARTRIRPGTVTRAGTSPRTWATSTRSGIHTGEDWNGRGGGDTDFGQPVMAVATGKVVVARRFRTRGASSS